SLLLTASGAFAASPTLTLCVPQGENQPIKTPKKTGCGPKFTLVTLNVEGKEGKRGPTGATGATGANGTNGVKGATGATGPTDPKLAAIAPYINFAKEGVGRKPTIQVSGANLQIVNGEGKTATTNGAGNLIIGYDESPGTQSGSHDLIL